jgi:hypothetical protein
MFKFVKRRRLKRLKKEEDIYAGSVFVGPLIQRMKRPPAFNQYALRPFAIAALSNEMLFNRRLKYLEFGGGISTVLLAKFIQIQGLSTQIVTIDHDEQWLSLLTEWLEQEQLTEIVSLHHAPLTQSSTPFGETSWYNKEIVRQITEHQNFDLVLVDGPPGKGGFNRYSALPVLIENQSLASEYALFLDDANRKTEKEIVRKWSEDHGLKFSIMLDQVAITRKGQAMRVALSN